MNCEFCQSPVHIWFQCPKKPDGWKPDRLVKKSTAARKVEPQAAIAKRGLTDVSVNAVVVREGETTPKAGTQALPVDTILKPGRPSTGFDKKAYNRQYMRKRRAQIKAGIRIPKRRDEK